MRGARGSGVQTCGGGNANCGDFQTPQFRYADAQQLVATMATSETQARTSVKKSLVRRLCGNVGSHGF